MADPGLQSVDLWLFERIQARDQAALADLYDRHARLLFSVALRILRDRGEAEDVLQDVFVRVWDRVDSYDSALGTPLAWLVRVTRNRAIDRVRARAARPALADEGASSVVLLEPSRDPDPEAQASLSEAGRALVSALSRLPDEQRILIERAFYGGLTHTELAAAFNLPLGTVKTRIRTGVQALRAALGQTGGIS